jgi:hypothetical protein
MDIVLKQVDQDLRPSVDEAMEELMMEGNNPLVTKETLENVNKLIQRSEVGN